ncbi:hypothetical protein HUO13_11865 [Saccharopolyspora erythraea]|uniref:hypothetical protein n=1 Tax=Saccharopolyspora erythraea TaxID=1836 RepID=UPI001BA80204|nr:hypothetical protein [Saccharopolyspora erythraea]QUH01411.1 hypothetical protein HUO13_11865 [Saccharopolyspora erythraea]
MNRPTITLPAGSTRPRIIFDFLMDEGWFEDIFSSKRKFTVTEGPTPETRISEATGHLHEPGYRRLEAHTWEVDRLATLLRVAVISFGEVRFVDEEAGSATDVTAENVEQVAPRGKLTRAREDRARYFSRVLDVEEATPERVDEINDRLTRAQAAERGELEELRAQKLEAWRNRQYRALQEERAAETADSWDSTEEQEAAASRLRESVEIAKKRGSVATVPSVQPPKLDTPEQRERRAQLDRQAYRAASAPRSRRAPRFTKYL